MKEIEILDKALDECFAAWLEAGATDITEITLSAADGEYIRDTFCAAMGRMPTREEWAESDAGRELEPPRGVEAQDQARNGGA